MHVITKDEYDEAVEQLASAVFDPLGDSKFSLDELYEAVDNGEEEWFSSKAKDDIDHVIRFEHPWGNPESRNVGAIVDLPGHMLGAIIEFSGRGGIGDRDYRKKIKGVAKHRDPRRSLQAAAREALYADVRREVFSRMRSAVGERKKDEAEA